MDDFEVQPDTIGLEDKHDRVGDLPLDGLGPLLASNVGQTGETLDVHPGLIIPVLDKVVELSVGGILGGDLLVETNMTALEKCHAILMVPDLLLHLYELRLRTENSAAKE